MKEGNASGMKWMRVRGGRCPHNPQTTPRREMKQIQSINSSNWFDWWIAFISIAEEEKKRTLAQPAKQLHFLPALTAPRGRKGIAELLSLPCRLAKLVGAPFISFRQSESSGNHSFIPLIIPFIADLPFTLSSFIHSLSFPSLPSLRVCLFFGGAHGASAHNRRRQQRQAKGKRRYSAAIAAQRSSNQINLNFSL